MSKHCEHTHTTHVATSVQIHAHTHKDICIKAHADQDIYKDMACTYTHVQRHTNIHTHSRKHKQGEALPSLFHLIFVAFKITVNYSFVGCSDGS